MKTTKIFAYILTVILICFVVPNCTDLEEKVYDQIPADEFGKTNEQVSAIVAPIYNSFKSFWPGDGFVINESTADMAMTPTRRGGDWWDGGQHMELYLQTWTYNTNAISSTYDIIMNAISTCNQVYSTISANTVISSSDKKIFLAEIRGVRAYWYYMYVDMFGNGPLVNDFNNTEVPGTTSRKELFNFVISELNAIKSDLRSDVSLATYSRFTKGAAYAVLAKMYLNAEEWVGTAMWQEAADACDTIMSLPYVLESNWRLSFEVQNEASKEIIFARAFSISSENTNHLLKRTLHYMDPVALGFTLGTWNGISANPDFVRSFDLDDQRYGWSFLIGPMIDPATGEIIITAHDKELIHTIDIPIIPGTEKQGTAWGEVEQHVGARCYKWVIESGTSNTDMANDYAIFRLADFYLVKAEALVRMNKDNTEATRLVNEIRKRAFDDPGKLFSSVTLDDIYKERRFEMAWEMCTRQDMIRFGTFLDPKYLKPEKSPEYRKLFPIPFTALSSNDKLVQNEGYK